MSRSRFLSRVATSIIILMILLSSVQPAFAAPSNDNFADAMQITSLPFNVNASNVGATFEGNEPVGCWWGYPLKTVWFSYTASSNVALTVKLLGGGITPLLTIYTGSSVDSLTQISCQYFNNNLTFVPQAGTTYYFQFSGLFGDEGNIPFAFDVAAPPQVQVNFYPNDPNVYDNVSFYPYINDPVGVSTYAWSTSDGATSDQYSFNHQFAADGDYTVNLTVTTPDGRTGSGSQAVQVRTRDVSINKFSIPQTARVNQTKAISVDITNNRYSDYVQVALIKGLPGGGEQTIGYLTLYVPARATRPTTFKFSYTFTSNDAAVGKVVFKAVATLVNGRDALPSDNTLIGTTLVTK